MVYNVYTVPLGYPKAAPSPTVEYTAPASVVHSAAFKPVAVSKFTNTSKCPVVSFFVIYGEASNNFFVIGSVAYLALVVIVESTFGYII